MTSEYAETPSARRAAVGRAEVVAVLVAWIVVSVALMPLEIIGAAKLLPTVLAAVIAFTRGHGSIKWVYGGILAVALTYLLLVTPILGSYTTESVIINP